jgi:hypothetical protein
MALPADATCRGGFQNAAWRSIASKFLHACRQYSNKDGVRYRYYVSHTLLQRRERDAGGVTRVPAVQLEKLVVEAIRAKAQPDTEPEGGLSDRAVIDRYVMRIIVRPDSIDIELREPTAAPPSSLYGFSP